MRGVIMLIGMLAAGAGTGAATGPASWRLVYSSDFHGELKPCGCSAEGNLGGILRRATKFEQLRKENIDTLFVSAGDILGEGDEQDRIKARYMLEAHTRFGLDAMLPGERELLYPVPLLERYRLPWVLTNNATALPFPRHRQRSLRAGTRVLMLGALDPTLFGANAEKYVSDPRTAVAQEIQQTGAKPEDIVIVLVHGGTALAQHFAGQSLVDVVVRGHLDAPVEEPVREANKPVLSAGHRGQRIGVAELASDQTTRLTDNRIVTLPRSVADHRKMSRLYKRYDKDVTAWYRKKAAEMKTLDRAASPYATAGVCLKCHSDMSKAWQKSPHADTLAILTRDGKDGDPECLVCHNTGMGQEGGFIDAVKTPELSDVQCEACHGPGRRHAEYPLAVRLGPAPQGCMSCHTPENSPGFDYPRYWARVAHPMQTRPHTHDQAFSPIKGQYDLLDPAKPVIGSGPVEITEYFNFYCKRCYKLDGAWPDIRAGLAKPVVYRGIPILFSNDPPWASLAYLVAEQAGKAETFKRTVFVENFEYLEEISRAEFIIGLADNMGLGADVRQAFDELDTEIDKQFEQGMKRKDQLGVDQTPTLIVNGNLRIAPRNTADNTGLLIENLEEILADIQCRQHGICQGHLSGKK